MIKLIAIDIDGTLVNSNRELTTRVKETLIRAKNNGIKVVLCTGRPLKGVHTLLKELELDSPNQYVITYNGALVISADGKNIIKEFPLNLQDVAIIEKFAKAHNTYYHVADREYIYTTLNDIGVYMAHEANLVNMPIRVRTLKELEQLNITVQKMMITDEPEKLDDVISKVPQSLHDNYLLVKSAPFYLEILNKQANKGNAVIALANYLNIDISTVMGIGDNYNDIDMLKVVGHSVAMGNAVDAVKNLAKYHTTSNDEDGVAVIVENEVLSQLQ